MVDGEAAQGLVDEAALASHGRSHRFDPCHAHQHKTSLWAHQAPFASRPLLAEPVAVAALAVQGQLSGWRVVALPPLVAAER